MPTGHEPPRGGLSPRPHQKGGHSQSHNPKSRDGKCESHGLFHPGPEGPANQRTHDWHSFMTLHSYPDCDCYAPRRQMSSIIKTGCHDPIIIVFWLMLFQTKKQASAYLMSA